jgi:hypothetical protein
MKEGYHQRMTYAKEALELNANLMKAFSVSLYGNEPVGAGAEIVIHAL